MKSEKKLEQAISYLRMSEEAAATAAMRMLREFLTDNTQPPKSKFNIYDWVAKGDDMRRSMHGVYHDPENKCAVATDGRVMFVSPAMYDPAHAGQCVDKYGADALNGGEYAFPMYDKVLASYDANSPTPAVFLGKEKIAELDRNLATMLKLSGIKLSPSQRRGDFGILAFTDPITGRKYPCGLEAALLATTLPQGGKWTMRPDGTQFSCTWEDGTRIMIMGLCVDEDTEFLGDYIAVCERAGLRLKIMRETAAKLEDNKEA